MDNAANVALSRVIAQTRAMDVTAGNLANMTTPGYRAERMVFGDWLSRQQGGTAAGSGSIVYTQDRASYRDRQSGELTHTANPLDLAITAEGYFTVLGAAGPRLTRAGHFTLGQDGTVVDETGDALLDTAGKKLQLAPADTRVTVAGDGTISSENGQIGKVGIVTAVDPNRLKAEGNRLLNATDTATTLVATPQIVQGALEQSNVQPAMEVNRMMTDLRSFQMVSQFMQSEADRQQSAIDKIMQQRS
jgi:flagellar basal-body rod protein FlgF